MIYLYKCRSKVPHVHEVDKSMRDPHPEFCPEQTSDGSICGASVYRVFVKPPAVIYRGSGFYSTDKILYDPPDPYYDQP